MAWAAVIAVVAAVALLSMWLRSGRHVRLPDLQPRAIMRVEVVGGALTKFATFARPGNQDVVLIVPGNPGVVEFYEVFARGLFQALGRSADVVVVSHGNHVRRADPLARAALRARGAPWRYRHLHLQEQVQHKVAVVRDMQARRPDARLFLVGHSIGAHLVLQIMRHVPEAQLGLAVLLYPTIMHIGSTPNGRRLAPVFRYLRPVAAGAAHALSWLPAPLQERLASRHASSCPSSVAGVRELLDFGLVSNALWMAKHEMEELLEADDEVLAGAGDRVVGYFSLTDAWVPLSHHHHLARKHPRAAWHLCAHGTAHAFTLRSADIMALQVGAWVAQARSRTAGAQLQT